MAVPSQSQYEGRAIDAEVVPHPRCGGLLDVKLNSSPRPVHSSFIPGVPNPRVPECPWSAQPQCLWSAQPQSISTQRGLGIFEV